MLLFVYVFVVVARQCAPVCFSEKHIRYNAVNVLANKYKGCWRVQKLPASDMRAMPCCLVTRFSLRLGTLQRSRRSRRTDVVEPRSFSFTETRNCCRALPFRAGHRTHAFATPAGPTVPTVSTHVVAVGFQNDLRLSLNR